MSPRLVELEGGKRGVVEDHGGSGGEGENNYKHICPQFVCSYNTKPQAWPCTNLSSLGKAASGNVSRPWVFNVRTRGNSLSPHRDSNARQGHTNVDNSGTKKHAVQMWIAVDSLSCGLCRYHKKMITRVYNVAIKFLVNGTLVSCCFHFSVCLFWTLQKLSGQLLSREIAVQVDNTSWPSLKEQCSWSGLLNFNNTYDHGASIWVTLTDPKKECERQMRGREMRYYVWSELSYHSASAEPLRQAEKCTYTTCYTNRGKIHQRDIPLPLEITEKPFYPP